MEQVRHFVDMIASDQMADAKDVLDEMLSSTAFERMEGIKHNIATSLFGQNMHESRATDAPAELD